MSRKTIVGNFFGHNCQNGTLCVRQNFWRSSSQKFDNFEKKFWYWIEKLSDFRPKFFYRGLSKPVCMCPEEHIEEQSLIPPREILFFFRILGHYSPSCGRKHSAGLSKLPLRAQL